MLRNSFGYLRIYEHDGKFNSFNNYKFLKFRLVAFKLLKFLSFLYYVRYITLHYILQLNFLKIKDLSFSQKNLSIFSKPSIKSDSR